MVVGKNSFTTRIMAVLIVLSTLVISGCSKTEKTVGGALIGAGVGAGIGAAAGGGTGAAVGAASGAVLGGVVGRSTHKHKH